MSVCNAPPLVHPDLRTHGWHGQVYVLVATSLLCPAHGAALPVEQALHGAALPVEQALHGAALPVEQARARDQEFAILF